MSKFAQTFSKTKKNYIYNDEEKNIVECGEIDIQKQISSYKYSTLEVILDKYLDIDLNTPLGDFSYNENDVVEIPERDPFEIENQRQEILSDLQQNGINEKNMRVKAQEIKEKIKKGNLKDEKKIEQEEK